MVVDGWGNRIFKKEDYYSHDGNENKEFKIFTVCLPGFYARTQKNELFVSITYEREI